MRDAMDRMHAELNPEGARVAVWAARVVTELDRARRKFPRPQSGPHEGYAVLLEEVDEMWDAIKANDIEHASREAVQVAAIALRFLVEVGVEPGTAARQAADAVRERQVR